jgi:SMC interacting uncharacterized protein involved in chromosome segregation|tara:strand:+ start:2942 stop:3250 length:309 start_codon:yes stop_codon:yes gene_type:complete
MELDARLMLTLAGMLASVVSAAVIVKTKLSAVIEKLDDVEQRLRTLDTRLDTVDVQVNAANKAISIFREMFNPKERDSASRELERHKIEIAHLRESISELKK